MIELARGAGCPVIVSGSDATDHPDSYLARGAAAVILGEGEVTLADLVERLISGTSAQPMLPASPISMPTGAVLPQPGRARSFVRSTICRFPAWDLVDVDRYRAIWRSRHGYHSMNLATTRGCPYHCNWCAKPIYGQRYAVRSPAAVVDEIALAQAQFAPDHFWIRRRRVRAEAGMGRRVCRV